MESSFVFKMKAVEAEKIVAAGTPWSDPEFQAGSLNSLFAKNSRMPDQQREIWKAYVWKRPKELFNGEEFNVFVKGIEANDIIQGSLGNCYFLSAISAIAEKPDRIKQLFLNSEVNEAGCYTMRLCINGEFLSVTVDDQFPYSVVYHKTAFTKGKENELWVLLLEKAWAKVNQSYEATIKGYTSEAFMALTGAPVEFYSHQNIDEELWDKLAEGAQKNYIICASSGKWNMDKHEYSKAGLVSDHSYAILGAFEVPHPNNQGTVKLLKLRNPWGRQEWMGDWSDKSSLWTAELKKLLKVEAKDDGIFFICLRDYMNYYRSTTICKVIDNYNYRHVKVQGMKHQYQLIQMEIKDMPASKVFFTVTQVNPRFVPAQFQYELAFVKFLVARLDSDGVSFIDGTCSNYIDVTLEPPHDLQPGTYMALVEFQWAEKQDRIRDFVFSVYSQSSQIAFTVLPHAAPDGSLTDLYHKDQFLCEMLKSRARQLQEKVPQKKQSYADKGEPNIYKTASIADALAEFGYVYFENQSQNEGTLVETYQIQDSSNLQFVVPSNESHRDGNNMMMRLEPGKDEIVLLKRAGRMASYSITCFTYIVYPDERYLAEIREAGNQQQIKYHGEYREIYFYSMACGLGYFFLYENRTTSTKFQATFEFQLNNLKIEGVPGNKIVVELGPGEKAVHKLVMIDHTQAFGYKFKYTQKCLEILETDEIMFEIVKTQGQRKQIKFQGESLEIFYWVHFLNEKYIWLFESFETRNLTLKATFTFAMENLAIEGYTEDPNSFKIELAPGGKAVRSLVRKNPQAETKYKCTYSFVMEGWLEYKEALAGQENQEQLARDENV